eukprot:CAMPEP_0204916634 /NCGR_PEP_ID=MMETSP1397-20131031/14395_1 /ASSEMBLY_ACC=CAM_ASM_000891 /TAXON_ID=49980 /ORGANISM="Climacostomum Climacostomum virens, Strain Stock W-24" /LENGTH=173 /DNA_ID=CAMNT_0052089211 /DNA_START=451 /DNA_END=972 /DNA_ORIENTATION=+
MEHLSAAKLTTLVFDAVDAICGLPVKCSQSPLAYAALDELKPLLRRLIGQTPDLDSLTAYVGSTAKLPEDKASAIAGSFLVRRLDLQRHYKEELLSRRLLTNFDWNVNIIVCTSKMTQMRVPVLHLELFVKEESGQEDKIIFEFDKASLTQFLSQLTGIYKTSATYAIAQAAN